MELSNFAFSFFKEMFQISPDPLFIIDRKSMRFIDANLAAYKSIGYSRDELMELSPDEIKPLFSKKELEDRFDVVIQNTPEVSILETLQERKDKSRFDVEIFYRPFELDGNSLLLASEREITQRKLKSEELTYNSYLLENVSEAIIFTDENLLVKRWNKAAEKMYGFNEKQAIGKSITSLINSKLSEEEKKRSFDDLNEKGFYKDEYEHADKSGKPVHIYASVSVIYDTEKKIIGYAAVHRDISEKKIIEKKLKISEEQFKTLVNGVKDYVIYILDPSGIIETWNDGAKNILGYDSHEIIGKHASSLYSDIAIFENQFDHILKKVTEYGKYQIEGWRLRKDGSKFWANEVFTAMVNAEKELIGISNITKDSTEKMEYQEYLYNFNKNLEEQVLRKTNDMAKVLERITDGFMAVDKNWKYTYLNKKVGEIFNFIPSDLIGTQMGIIYPDENHHSVNSLWQKALIEQKFLKSEHFFPLLDAWLEIDIYPSPDGLSIFFRDISERKYAEQSLSESELRYRTLVEHASDAILIMDETGKYLEVNTSACNMAGYTRQEILQLNSKNLFKPVENKKVFEDKISWLVSGKSLIEESCIQKKDGTLLQVESNAIKLPDGRFLEIVRDINERKKDEVKLRQSESRLKASQQLARIGNWSCDFQKKSIEWSDEVFKIFGIPVNRAEIDYNTFMNSVYLEDRDFVEDTINKSIKNKTGFDIIHRINTGTNKIKHVNVKIENLYDNNNNIIGSNGTVQDISDRVKAEQDLKKSYDEIRQLASHLQHIREEERTSISREIHDELGQQLTALKMGLYWLNQQSKLNAIERKLKINELLRMLDTIMNDVRRIATDLRPSLLNNLGLIDALAWYSNDFQTRSGIQVEFNTELESLQLSQNIVTNFFRIYQESLTNVARHAAASKVFSSLVVIDGHITLTISDNGQGFESSMYDQKKTLGILGMKERTLMMGGTYKIESKPGQGTIVCIKVPTIR